jgi:NADH-quinone oxidoreductase subunit M
VYAIIATTGVIVAAVYMLWMVRRVFFGHLDKQENGALTDLNFREVGVMLPLIILMFVIGFHATPFLIEINRSSDQIVQQVLNVTTGLANH